MNVDFTLDRLLRLKNGQFFKYCCNVRTTNESTYFRAGSSLRSNGEGGIGNRGAKNVIESKCAGKCLDSHLRELFGISTK